MPVHSTRVLWKNIWMGRVVSQVGAEFLGFCEAMKCCQMLQAHDRSHAAYSFST